ncbi:hypothetical protein Nocox_20360 [Nonomuraea coxensis DSM 45129]|uniref:Uncharacterized protein n=1 Tax=Nonomuraea coxensis DSM 45129 TaxID=1122611 RepID=A0ABX8U2L0_9ACTN|nr:hypothetical protein [Nonomuraea coxensis]QYC41681.1 hypothetical protein Nocox_20360 [Nonomuraea coxensis DSM 45129]
MFQERRTAFDRTLAAIVQHQQGHHGWSHFHRLVRELLAGGHPEFSRVLETVWSARPHISDAHLITLTSAAVRQIALREKRDTSLFDGGVDDATRLRLLRDLVERHGEELAREMCGRSNSFTGARRFLVPQLIIGGFAAEHGLDEVRFLDLGTGVGILPRQLNNKAVYDRFGTDLAWEPYTPEYRTIPLALRVGADAPPLPSMEWLRSCYGPSEYYEERLEELLWSFDMTAEEGRAVVTAELDILDLPRLAHFLRTNRFNVITCNFVLFQYDVSVQKAIEACVMDNIASPGLFLTMNPSHGLLRPGCQVRGRLAGEPKELRLVAAGDAHLIGTATIEADFPVVMGGRQEKGIG